MTHKDSRDVKKDRIWILAKVTDVENYYVILRHNTNLFTTMVGLHSFSGIYLRVATEHYAYDGSFKETAWNYTSGVYMP